MTPANRRQVVARIATSNSYFELAKQLKSAAECESVPGGALNEDGFRQDARARPTLPVVSRPNSTGDRLGGFRASGSGNRQSATFFRLASRGTGPTPVPPAHRRSP